MSNPKPIYIQKSNQHAKIHAYLIVDIAQSKDDEKNFTVTGRLLPLDRADETRSFYYTGFDDTCKRPVIGDVHFETIDCDTNKTDGRGSWNTMANFNEYWVLKEVAEAVASGNLAFSLNRIKSIDLRPLLPKKDDPLFQKEPAYVILDIEVPPGAIPQVVKLPADIFRRFNPKVGHHYFVENGNIVFYTPEEFTRLVFTTFNAKRKQKQEQ